MHRVRVRDQGCLVTTTASTDLGFAWGPGRCVSLTLAWFSRLALGPGFDLCHLLSTSRPFTPLEHLWVLHTKHPHSNAFTSPPCSYPYSRLSLSSPSYSAVCHFSALMVKTQKHRLQNPRLKSGSLWAVQLWKENAHLGHVSERGL